MKQLVFSSSIVRVPAHLRSPDGQTLMMSSSDGYCSVVVFDYAELGHPYNYSVQPSLQALSSNSAAPPAPAHHAHGTSSPALGNKASGAAVSHPASNQAPASSPAAARTESLTSSGSAAQSAPAPALGLGLSTGTGTATGPDHASTSAYASGLAMMTPPPTPSPAPALAAASSSAANEHVGTTTGASAEPKKKKRRIAPTLESGLGS